MAKKNLGRVSPLFKGDWNEHERYEELDIVFHNGCSWACTKNCMNVEPDFGSEFWVIASVGTQGTEGMQGLQGETGAQGIAGEYAAQGAQGLQGETGAQGATGSQGAAGQDGINGQDGAQGADGMQGATGAQGANPSSTVEIWTFTLANNTTITRTVYIEPAV